MGAVKATNLKLFTLRKAAGLSQIETAQKLEIPVNLYAAIERGESNGKTAVWDKIQKLFNVPDEEMWQLIRGSM
jgi:transcriptional regulator with XRE-family HTH domain